MKHSSRAEGASAIQRIPIHAQSQGEIDEERTAKMVPERALKVAWGGEMNAIVNASVGG